MVDPIAPPDSLALLRQQWLDNASSTASVQAPPGLVSNGRGGFNEGAEPDPIEYAASFGPFSARTSEESVIQERYVGEALGVIYLPHNAVVTTLDIITMDGVIHDVVGVVPPRLHQVKRRVIVRARSELVVEEAES